MSTKRIIREAEEAIEGILQELQDQNRVRPFRLQVEVDEDGEIEVTIIKDERFK